MPDLMLDSPFFKEAGPSSAQLNPRNQSIPTPPTERAPGTFLSVGRGETWSQSFANRKPDIPSEIIPGLYLGNAKTAAAYLLGQTDHTYPTITRMLTIMSDMDVYTKSGFPRLPEAAGEGKGILRMFVEKNDSLDVNILETFDRTCKFIHEGIDNGTSSTDPSTASAAVSEVSIAIAPTVLTTNAADIMSRLITSSVTMAPNDNSETVNTSVTTTQALMHKRVQPGAVLVHCHAGISRSATLVVAYLLKHHSDLIAAYEPSPLTLPVATTAKPGPEASTVRNSTANAAAPIANAHINALLSRDLVAQAIRFVQSKREIVNPNIAFRMQLNVYHDELGCELVDEEGKFKGGYLDWWDEWDEESSCVRVLKGSSVFAS